MVRYLGIIARNRNILRDYRKEIRKSGFKYSLKKADIILCLGGDGTFLEAERKYPKIPKLLIKDSKVCDKCNVSLFDDYIDRILEKKFKIETSNKLECYINGKRTRFVAVNDIIIRNKEVTQAIRFNVFIEGKRMSKEELIGDGIVVSTPFGSTAYFNSMTGKKFKKGIGVALNNTKGSESYKILSKDDSVKLIINRGKAEVAADNYRMKRTIRPYDEVVIKISKEKMNRIILK